jgi:hypothetical protein
MGVRARLPSLTYLPEQIGKNRRTLPDDDALTIAQGIPSVGAAVHISVDGVDPGERRVPATPTACRCTMKMNGRFPAGERQLPEDRRTAQGRARFRSAHRLVAKHQYSRQDIAAVNLSGMSLRGRSSCSPDVPPPRTRGVTAGSAREPKLLRTCHGATPGGRFWVHDCWPARGGHATVTASHHSGR